MNQLPPIRDEESGHCSRQCPHLIKWEHPFWNETAWCDLQMCDLSFYDGFLADCIDNKPDPFLTAARDRLRFNAKITGLAPKKGD
jgi:hypothetical protein